MSTHAHPVHIQPPVPPALAGTGRLVPRLATAPARVPCSMRRAPSPRRPAPGASESCNGVGMSAATVSVAYAGRDGAHAAAACEQMFSGRPGRPPAELHRGRRGRCHGQRPVRRASDRELALRARRRDARPAPRLAALDRGRDDPADPPLPPRRRGRPARGPPFVRSHPVALDQCRRLIAAMPWATAIAPATTAEAAARSPGTAIPTEAAIAGERAASLYGLEVIAGDVGDHPEAYTRFVSLAPPRGSTATAGEWRTAFSFVTDHRPGRAAPRDRAVRPARDRPRPARLAADPATRRGATASTPCSPAIRSTRRSGTRSRGRAMTRRLKVFGSYPAGEGA